MCQLLAEQVKLGDWGTQRAHSGVTHKGNKRGQKTSFSADVRDPWMALRRTEGGAAHFLLRGRKRVFKGPCEEKAYIRRIAGLGLGAGVSASVTSNEGRESAHEHGGV